MAMGRIHTDLALETKEKFEEDNVEIRGVEIQEDYDEEKDIRTTVVKIKTENGAKSMGRPQGVYITLEAPNMSVPDEDYHREISRELSRHLKALLPKKEDMKVLVVGLGNRDITPDALGPDVVANLRITRHIINEYGAQGMGEEHVHSVSGLAPGVMAQTGMETMEIIRGVIEETRPDIIVAIDALAARSLRRLNRTIQITDTGINPGSGVGNHRTGLNRETLGVRVIGIGVPTVVDGATIVHDAMSHLLDALEEAEKKGVELIYVTLHVGIGTFRPVKCENVEEHTMHFEEYSISDESARAINKAKREGRRIISVGTTSTRTVESAAYFAEGVQAGSVDAVKGQMPDGAVAGDGCWQVRSGEGSTGIFIYPGYEFKIVDSLITNFHLPKSTLLMLISALYNREKILEIYEEAVRERYRFFSYGDAMLIL